MIDPAFRARAETALTEVERAEGVRVLLAVESGSRAWGFASRDSDYDVRFIFLRPLADYLSVAPVRDVVERPIDALLDLGGWDARKALGLLARGNAVALEWLGSPVVYRQEPAAVALLREVARAAAYGPVLAYHYDRLARHAWQEGEGKVRLKSYFYALRPALALRWLRERGTPPMDLPSLLAGVAVPGEVVAAVEALRRAKEATTEADVVPRQAVLDGFLSEALAIPAPRPPVWDTAPALAAADDSFRKLVLPGR